MDVTTGMATQLTKAVHWTWSSGKAAHDEHVAVSELMLRALAHAACPAHPTSEEATQLAVKIRDQLYNRPIPGHKHEGPLAGAKQLGQRTVAKVVRQAPRPQTIDARAFRAQLTTWVREGARDAGYKPIGRTRRCGRAPEDPESYAALFLSSFHLEVADPRQPSQFRDALLERLEAADRMTDYRHNLFRQHLDRMLAAAGGGGVIGAATGIALAQGAETGDGKATAIGAGVGVVSTAAGVARGRHLERAKRRLRAFVAGWAAAYLRAVTGRDPGRRLHDLRVAMYGAMRDNAETALAAAVGGLDKKARLKAIDALRADLSERLIPRAHTLDDDVLAEALEQLEDALIASEWDALLRDPRDRTPRGDVFAALNQVLDLVELPESADVSEQASSASSDRSEEPDAPVRTAPRRGDRRPSAARSPRPRGRAERTEG